MEWRITVERLAAGNVGCDLGARRHADLAQDVCHVHAHRAGRDPEGLADLPIGHPPRDERGNLDLTIRQNTIGAALGRPAAELPQQPH
jgi:hypothetical protein